MKKILLSLLLMGFSLIGAAQAPTITSFTPSYGAVGTLVTITGTNLTSPTVFTIGGANPVVISNTGSSLVAMVMPDAITGTVSVTTAGGTAVSSSNFTVMPTPVPNTPQGNKLVGTGAGAGAYQSYSVAISADGNTAITGANNDNSGNGAVWIYTRNGDVWTQQGAKLVGTGNTGSAGQGIAVALSADGNTALVGGYNDNTGIGAAWIFTRNGSTWSQQGNKLVGTGYIGNASQGGAVSLSADGNTAIVGGYSDDSNKGAVWVFTRSGNTWTQQGNKLIGTGSVNAASQGVSVAISADGNTLVEGGNNDNNSEGAIWIFTRSGNTWTQQGNKLAGTGNTGPAFQGFSVAINANGNTVIEGGANDVNTGATWVFTRSGTTWTQQGNKLVGTGSVGSASQGSSVSLSADGNAAVIGAPNDNNGAGAFWTFKRNGTTWTQQGNKMLGTGNVGNAAQGISVAMNANGGYLIESGYLDNTDIGAAWTFKYISNNADLSSLTLSAGALTPVFDAATITYTAGVSAATNSITVTPVKADPNAVIAVQVNGAGFAAVTSGTASAALPLSPGSNTIQVRVSAQDGTTIKTYSITVNKLTDQTITFAALSNRTYGDAPFNLAATGGASGNAVTYVSSNTTVATVSGNTVTILAAGTTNITASQAGNASYNAATDVMQPLIIDKKIITVTAEAKGKTYGDIDPVFTYTFTPALVTGDNFTGALSRAGGENVGAYAILQNTLALSTNYILNYTGADLSIGTKTINVTADPKIKTYGDLDPALTYTASPALAFSDAFSGTLVRIPGENVGSYTINKNTLSLGANYVLNYTAALLNITSKTITVSADAQSKTYGDADPAFTYTFTPALITGDNFTGTLSRSAGENIGTYAINQNTLTLSTNYLLSYTAANLSIGTKIITVSANTISKTYGDADPVLPYTYAPALAAGDDFTGELGRTAGEDVGTYAMNQNTLALSSNYVLNYSSADLSITTKTVNVTADVKSKTYGDADPAFTYTFTPVLVTGDNFTGALSRTAGENIGTYAINQNTLELSSNYILNYTAADLNIGTKTITVSADAKSKTYGDADPAFTYTFAPALVTGDNFTGNLNRTAGEDVGSYSIIKNTLSLSSNYILNYTAADLNIGAKTITVSADAKSKTYGDADPAFTYTFTPALVTGANFTGELNRTSGEDVGSYSINKSTLSLGSNYILNYTTADLIIGANTQSISFSTLADKLSTDAIFTLDATATSGLAVSYASSDASIARIVNGNQVEILKEGTITITATQDGNGNYTAATPVSQQLIINNNPVPVIVIISNKGSSISKGETATLTASGANTYQWTAANGIISGENTAVLTVRPSITTTYTVTGTTQYNRTATQTFTIEVKNDLKTADATNILTPDGDGINDYWIVKNIELYPNNEVKIFDRSGRLIYSKKNYDNTWGATLNGSPLAEGTYYYIINYGNDTGIKKGYISIIRRK